MSPSPNDEIRVYSRTQIETASQPKLICMLHDQCVLQLRHARSIDQSLRRPLLDRVQNMLVILQRSLKITDATSQSLFHLYDYCYCLLEYDARDELTNAQRIIDTLRQTFEELQKHPE